MTTGLVEGLKLSEAAEAVAQRAASLLQPGQRLALHTERGRNSVMIGVAVPGACCAVLVDNADYNGLKLAELVCALEG